MRTKNTQNYQNFVVPTRKPFFILSKVVFSSCLLFSTKKEAMNIEANTFSEVSIIAYSSDSDLRLANDACSVRYNSLKTSSSKRPQSSMLAGHAGDGWKSRMVRLRE